MTILLPFVHCKFKFGKILINLVGIYIDSCRDHTYFDLFLLKLTQNYLFLNITKLARKILSNFKIISIILLNFRLY